jgi:uncharacterized protein (DUF1015 family)
MPASHLALAFPVSVPLLRPFAALRPRAEFAARVAAPPYDVLSSEEARTRAAGNPWSFLHISKPEIDLPAGVDPYAPEVYETAAANLRRMIAAGVLQRDPAPRFYAYRMTMGGHTQTGIAGAASVAAYDANRIRRHEFTRPDKEDDRVRQIEALGAQTGPVLLAYPDAPEVDEVLAAVTQHPPCTDITADTGVRHVLWPIDDPVQLDRLVLAFDALDALYIADGHHRSAAASRVAARRRASGAGADASHESFLAVAFPAAQMQILPYNRVVADLHGLSVESFLARVGARFSVQHVRQPVWPARPHEFGLFVGGEWYRLEIHPHRVPQDDPVRRLDVSLLAEHLLEPVLGITDPRRDRRIDFVGGIRGLDELERRVTGGGMACAISLYATRMADLMAVADAGAVMPPKSTWFEPKLADGLLSHVLD